jgi:hypothetical protein
MALREPVVSGGGSSGRRIGAAVVVALLAMVLGAPPAQAAPWYYYKPGQPMGPTKAAADNCTGGWAVRGEMGLFFLTAGHCQAQGTVVHGYQKAFGTVLRNDDGKGMDAALVQPYAGVDALQDVVDRSDSVIGHTIGIVPNSELATPGLWLNKMGRKTGWTWGTTDGRWMQWNGEWVKCAELGAKPGDSGGPVFIRDAANRARAAGMIVGGKAVGGVELTCFHTIEDLLVRFGAWLPVFSATGAVSYVGPSDVTVTDRGPATVTPGIDRLY